MIDPQRVRDCMPIFFSLLKVDPKFTWNAIPISDILPFLEKDLCRHIIEQGDKAEAVLNWIADFVFYVRGDTDDMPQLDYQLELNVE